MAQVNGTISVETIDHYGITGTTLYNVTVDDSKTVLQLTQEAIALAGAQTPLTQGAEGTTRITLEIAGTGEPGGGDIEKGGLFNFNNATDSYATGFFVPAINPSVLNANGLIDLTNTDVANWIAWLTTAHAAITVVTKGVRALTSLKDALISFRKHRKPLSRKTKEV